MALERSQARLDLCGKEASNRRATIDLLELRVDSVVASSLLAKDPLQVVRHDLLDCPLWAWERAHTASR